MFKISLCLLLFTIFIGCTAKDNKSQPLVNEGYLDLTSWNFDRDGVVSLDGSWEFYWNLFLDPVDFGSRLLKPRVDLKFIQVPGQWQKSNYSAHGFATYRLLVGLSDPLPELSISLRDAGTAYDLYVDGKLAQWNGKVGTSKSESSPFFKYSSTEISHLFNDSKSLAIVSPKLRKVEILVRISNFHYSHGGLWSTIKLGSSRDIRDADRYKLNLDLIVFSALFVMGLYHLGLFLNRRKDKSPLYFGIFCVLVSLRTVSINERMILDAFTNLPFELVHKFEYLSYYLGFLAFTQFVHSLFPLEFSKKFIYFASIILTPCTFLVFFFPMEVYNESLVPVQILTVLSIIYVIFSLLRAVLRKRLGAKLFLFGWLAFAIAIINDILKNLGIVQTPTITSYGLLIFIIFQASILSRKFASAFSQVENLADKLQIFSEELEDKVSHRTIELQQTLEKVQELKIQQDGDYFLTSLLLKPLNQNKAESKSLKLEFFSSQKKKFQFKEWKEEIGGDLCMSNTIILKGRRYTVYVNADAMGKSLQGAGGALVLGSVFESIINRNRYRTSAQNYYPENWIKESFLELHRVFETFDGSMLVSLVLALIDEENGFYYSINAEHPWTILYRDGKASFLNTESGYQKLGTLGVKNHLQIFTYQLHPNDILLSGSDGKDDILLSKTETQMESINEDESMILGHIERTDADLIKIHNEILATGIPIDDITMIKMTYLGAVGQEAIFERQTIYIAQRDQFREYLRSKNFQLASSVGKSLVGEITEDTELLFQISYVFKKNREFEASCELGERVRLRDPNHVRNLINLTDSYFFSGDYKRSKFLINIVLKLDKSNKHALKRSSEIEKIMNDFTIK